MGSKTKSIKLDSPEAEKYLSELFGIMVTYGSKVGQEMNDKCITCNKDKDEFSKNWEYQECQSCSMKGQFNAS